MKNKRVALGFSVFLFTLLLRATYASMLEQWDTQKLTKESKSIQVGEVVTKWSSYDPERRMTYTYVKLKINQTLKGVPQKETLLRIPGGEADGIRTVVHGVANFRLKEKALVFVNQAPDGAPEVVGMTQGKFNIHKDLVTGEEMAQFKVSRNVEFYTRSSTIKRETRHVVSSHAERRLPLKDLIQEIQIAIRAEADMPP